MLLVSCSGGEPTKPDSKGSKANYDVSYYNNNDFNNFVLNGNSLLANQWSNYGLSSPFIMRFNGEYYLYASTTSNANENGIRAWKSKDLIHYEPITGEGLPKGYVVSNSIGATTSARAPEVYYYNGSFYMYESYSDGAGHFILKADHPEGPFTSLTNGSIDEKYDGTLVFDKDENPYFVTAGKKNINVSTMEGMNSIISTDLVVNGTDKYLATSAESPSIFEYMGKYYLLYSSCYDKTDGYQMNYAVSDGWEDETPSGLANSFRYGATNKLLVNADASKGFTGLGHPSIVLGPDLDSYYVAYDCLDSGSQNLHSLNIDRLLIDGDMLSLKHNRFNSIAPSMPDFATFDKSGFKEVNNYLLSENNTKEAFSVEYNFRHAEDSELVFSYIDENNYSFVKVDMNNSIALYKRENGNNKLLKEVAFYNYFSNDDLHTIRLNYRENRLDVHFENSLKLNAFEVELGAGQVGYLKSDKLDINYTCYSNVARGMSNQKEVKQAEADILANTYMLSEQVEGVTSSYFNGDSGLKTITTEEYKNADELVLAAKYDYARYLLNFNQDGNYALELTLNKKYLGKNIIVEIDDEDDIELTIPNLKVEGEYAKVKLGNFNIAKGIHQFKIQNNDDQFGFVFYRFVEVSSSDYYLNSSLANEKEIRGLSFKSDGRWSFVDDAMISLENYRNIALVDNDNLSDVNISVDMNLNGSDSIFTESSETGIVFRASNYVSYKDYMDSYSDLTMWNERMNLLRGYYLAFTTRKISLYKLDVGGESKVQIASEQFAYGANKNRNVIIKVRDNRFDVFIDKKYVTTYYDDEPFYTGSVGLFTTGAKVAYKNLKVQAV